MQKNNEIIRLRTFKNELAGFRYHIFHHKKPGLSVDMLREIVEAKFKDIDLTD